jgi:hypothetical protein
MTFAPYEQRNAYKGTPSRPWVQLRLLAPDGTVDEIELLADTGNPCAIVIGVAGMARFKRRAAPDMKTNFGLLEGGWLRVRMPEAGLDQELTGFANEVVVAAAKASSTDFEGLAGLPLLRLFEYGGNADQFWLRQTPSPTGGESGEIE